MFVGLVVNGVGVAGNILGSWVVNWVVAIGGLVADAQKNCHCEPDEVRRGNLIQFGNLSDWGLVEFLVGYNMVVNWRNQYVKLKRIYQGSLGRAPYF